MSALDARLAALRALERTALHGARLDDALELALAPLDDARERALARALAFGTCRFWPTLTHLRDMLLERALKGRDRRAGIILLLGLHQLLQLRIPAHAAVSESVRLARRAGAPWAARMVNAVLRRAAREYADLRLDALTSDCARLAHPEWLLEALRAAWPEHWEQIARAGNEQGPMTLRVNRRHGERERYRRRLAGAGIDARDVDIGDDWLPEALTLERAVDVHELPGFADGDVSVQDAAAQLAAPLLAPRAGERLLDACAGPGGKSAHLLERAPDSARLVAVDVAHSRLEQVRETLKRVRQSHRACCIVADARSLGDRFPAGHFHRILLDAPCSASGVIRRHPDIKLRSSRERLAAATALQHELLLALWPLLARGGALLYATCSVMPAENRDVMAQFLGRCRDAEPLPIALPVGRPHGVGHQVLPGEAGMDGFFYALLAKA